MADRPVIFSGPMVRALLAGTKTQTRRVLRLQSIPFAIDDRGTLCDVGCLHVQGEVVPRVTLGRVVTQQKVPYAVGDRLWVREAHYLTDDGDEQFAVYACEDDDVREHLAEVDALPASFPEKDRAAHRRLRPSIHMPRALSRLTLTVTDVRVQRLQDISEEDARAEGITETADGRWTGAEGQAGATPRAAYAVLWNSLHGPEAWTANPFVVAISFTTTPANIDSLPEQAGGRA